MTATTTTQPARRLRALGAALLATVLMTSTLLSSSAAASTPTPEPTPAPAIPIGTTAFTLSPVGNGIVTPGEGLTVTVTLQNATTRPTPDHTVSLSVGTEEIADRRTLAAWLEGDTSVATTSEVATATLSSVDPDSEASKGILVPAEDPALADMTAGVYPLVASYEDESSTVTSTSVMIIPDDTADAASVGLIVPITAAPRSSGLLTADELEELTAPAGDLTNQLRAVDGTPAILAIDPAIVAAIRALGSAAPASAVDWLDQLLALPNSRFALQFGDADVAVQLSAGLSRPLSPRSLAPYMSSSNAPAASPSPSDGGEDAASPLPTTDALTDIGGAVENIYWPAPDAITDDALSTLGALTVDDQPSFTVLSSHEIAAGAAGATVGARARIDDARTLVYDSTVSTYLQSASLQGSGALRAADLTAATANLVLAAADTRGVPLLVTVGREASRSHVALRTAISAITDAPGFIEADLTELTDASARRAQVVDAEVSPERIDTVSHMLDDEAELGRFATILDDVSLITGPERAELLQLLSVGWTADTEAWHVAAAEHRLGSAETLDSVGLLPSSTINLFGSGAGLGFWVRNDLPYPVNLILYTAPDDLRLDVQRATPVTATASSNTRVEVPVQARVANGEVTLELQLRSPSSVAIGDSESVQVNVRAEWETVGIAALAIVVGGLLVAGVVRTVLRVRASKRQGDE
ncbi:DUF6049 family protein [Microbacterium sp. C7(2022)]|uniref:DUF6049 family protein n=1 Tax=Microbacterium sp. C7(2022) TaxID=2992759 RepID=UPI00237C2D4E|nr:DUF6049 family protein [Microbacterium sp. C7(2022)]MDE0546306.1 DUF6049 family protein [Microbacterium sp. C7(2022)]